MVFKLFIDKNCNEEVIAYVRERTPLIDEVERLISQSDLSEQIPGYTEDEIVMLTIQDIECFVVEGEKTFAITVGKRRYRIRKRLHELETCCRGTLKGLANRPLET